MGMTGLLRCPIAFVREGVVWHCQLNFGHRQWHQSFEHGNPGTIWPDNLGAWLGHRDAPEKAPPEVPLVAPLPELVAPLPEPRKVARPALARRTSLLFSREDWLENPHFSSDELLHANPRHYGLADESLLWWDDEIRGWEPDGGELGSKEMGGVRRSLRRWR